MVKIDDDDEYEDEERDESSRVSQSKPDLL